MFNGNLEDIYNYIYYFVAGKLKQLLGGSNAMAIEDAMQ
jgi:hypothetical protein